MPDSMIYAAEQPLRETAIGADFTDDVFLGGKVMVRQPARGYRAGIDPVLLAATVTATFAGRVLDVGAGAGTVGLCIAARCPAARVTLVERAPELVAFARHGVKSNGFENRVSVVAADILQAASQATRETADFDIVVANPPYYDDAGGTPAQTALKAASNAMPGDDLDAWLRFITRMSRPGGKAIMIHTAESLPRLFAAFDRRFGALRVLPIHPRANAPAHRILLSGVKGSRAPLTLLPPFVLHAEDGTYTPAATDIARNAAVLEFL